MSEVFNPEMLALAREARGLSQRDVTQRMSRPISQAKYSKIEGGLVQPSSGLAEELALALGFRLSFFFNNAMPRAMPVSYHRKRQKLTAKDLQAIHGRTEVLRLNMAKLLRSVEIEPKLPAPPAIDPDEYDGKVDAIAGALRQHWALPRGPVKEITKLIEDAGIVVIPFDFGSPLIDGFSQHATADMPAVIFINSTQPKDRLRFSLAHELGHLVMHRLPRPDMEVQANQFAGEFLVPWRDAADKFRRLSMTKFMELKLYWNVSMQCLIYQAWQKGALSDRAFRYYQEQMSGRGFRMKEPIELVNAAEAPSTFRQLVQAHLRELSYSVEELAELLGLGDEDMSRLYQLEQTKPRLRLVASN